VNAVGQISAAFEVAENARGMLYVFHRMSGEADLALQEGLLALRKAGPAELADEIDELLVGRGRIGVDASISCGSPEPGWSLGWPTTSCHRGRQVSNTEKGGGE